MEQREKGWLSSVGIMGVIEAGEWDDVGDFKGIGTKGNNTAILVTTGGVFGSGARAVGSGPA